MSDIFETNEYMIEGNSEEEIPPIVNGDMLKSIYDSDDDGIFSIANGGTGANTASEAFANLADGPAYNASALGQNDIFLIKSGNSWIRKAIGSIWEFVKSKLGIVTGSLDNTFLAKDGTWKVPYTIVSTIDNGLAPQISSTDGANKKLKTNSSSEPVWMADNECYLPRISDNVNLSPNDGTSKLAEYVNTASNLPTAHFYHILTNQSLDGNYASQLAMGMTMDAVFFRTKTNGAWNNWRKLCYGNYTKILSVKDIPTSATQYTCTLPWNTTSEGGFKAFSIRAMQYGNVCDEVTVDYNDFSTTSSGKKIYIRNKISNTYYYGVYKGSDGTKINIAAGALSSGGIYGVDIYGIS
jgi:hypothetical protein